MLWIWWKQDKLKGWMDDCGIWKSKGAFNGFGGNPIWRSKQLSGDSGVA
jgi:hypothetical protein